MPLPAALQARLLKRGIIHKEGEENSDTEDGEKEEKVEAQKEEDTVDCPNKWNPYHECVEYCRKRWGKKNQKKKKQGLSNKPLPPGWFSVPDPNSGHNYFWNVHTNEVSWLHPNHPKAEITLPASVLLMKQQQEQQQQEKENKAKIPLPPGEEESPSELVKEDETPTEKREKQKIKTGKHPSLLKAKKDKERLAPYRKKGESVDPMDPSSYSDAPRGSWSTGLKSKGEAKTGVDTTANGPLFQQRPYPSPGEVLRRNKQYTEDDED